MITAIPMYFDLLAICLAILSAMALVTFDPAIYRRNREASYPVVLTLWVVSTTAFAIKAPAAAWLSGKADQFLMYAAASAFLSLLSRLYARWPVQRHSAFAANERLDIERSGWPAGTRKGWIGSERVVCKRDRIALLTVPEVRMLVYIVMTLLTIYGTILSVEKLPAIYPAIWKSHTFQPMPFELVASIIAMFESQYRMIIDARKGSISVNGTSLGRVIDVTVVSETNANGHTTDVKLRSPLQKDNASGVVASFRTPEDAVHFAHVIRCFLAAHVPAAPAALSDRVGV